MQEYNDSKIMWLTPCNFVAAFAYCAYEIAPEDLRLDNGINAFKAMVKALFNKKECITDDENHKMASFTYDDLHSWFTEDRIGNLPDVLHWNQIPDFIDLHALARNTKILMLREYNDFRSSIGEHPIKTDRGGETINGT